MVDIAASVLALPIRAVINNSVLDKNWSAKKNCWE